METKNDNKTARKNEQNIIGRTVVSKEGAVITVHRLELSEAARQGLSTTVKTLDAPGKSSEKQQF